MPDEPIQQRMQEFVGILQKIQDEINQVKERLHGGAIIDSQLQMEMEHLIKELEPSLAIVDKYLVDLDTGMVPKFRNLEARVEVLEEARKVALEAKIDMRRKFVWEVLIGGGLALFVALAGAIVGAIVATKLMS